MNVNTFRTSHSSPSRLAVTRPSGAPGQMVGWVKRFEVLQQVCAEARLTARQADVVRRTCDEKSPAEIAEALEVSEECVSRDLAAGTKKLAKLHAARQLSPGERAAVLRAIQGRKEREGDPEWDPSCHSAGEPAPRVQGMRPFGMVAEDLDSEHAGATYTLLDVVCRLTGAPRPQLTVLQKEAPQPVKTELGPDGIHWVKRTA